jgi:hypothetical protein
MREEAAGTGEGGEGGGDAGRGRRRPGQVYGGEGAGWV